MLGHTRFVYRIRKAILGASILLIGFIAFEIVYGQEGLPTFQVTAKADYPATNVDCGTTYSFSQSAITDFNLADPDLASKGFKTGNYDVNLSIIRDPNDFYSGPAKITGIQLFFDSVLKADSVNQGRLETSFQANVGPGNHQIRVVVNAEAPHCREYLRFILSGVFKAAAAPKSELKPIIESVDLRVTDRYKHEHSLAPNGLDYERQGLDSLAGRCTDCKDIMGIINVYDEIEARAVVKFDGDVDLAKNFDVFFTIGGSGVPDLFLKDLIRLSRCKPGGGKYICSAVFNSKSDELKRGGFIWARALINDKSAKSVADKISQRLAVAQYNFGFFKMKFFTKISLSSDFDISESFFSSHISDQLQTMIAISDFNKKIEHSLKIISIQEPCDLTTKLDELLKEGIEIKLAKAHLDCSSINSECSRHLRQCADKTLKQVSYKGDRVIGVIDNLGNGYFDLSAKTAVVGNIGDDFVLAHEIGHSFGLGEEYIERFGKDYPIWRNEYPSCCIDSRVRTCEDKGGFCKHPLDTLPSSSKYAILFGSDGLLNLEFCRDPLTGNKPKTGISDFEGHGCLVPYDQFEKLGNHCLPTNYPYMRELINEAQNATSGSAFYGGKFAGACVGWPLTADGHITENRDTLYRSVMGNYRWRISSGKALYPPGAPCPLRDCPL